VGHGGVRKGAGRKPESNVMKKATAGEILSEVDEVELWKQLLNSSNKRIALDALKYLTDRRDGKAQQAVSVESKQPFEVKLTVQTIGT